MLRYSLVSRKKKKNPRHNFTGDIDVYRALQTFLRTERKGARKLFKRNFISLQQF